MLNNNAKHITTALYYDDKGRVVQSRVKNYLDTYDHTYNAYTFDGRIDSTYIDHTGNFPEKYTYKYDTSGRLTETWHKYSVLPAVQIAKNSYDEFGRLTTKKRHNETDTEQFEYNIQGWPKKITSGEFTQNLYYNAKPSYMQGTLCFNGNIAASTWTFNNNNVINTNGYQYEYDNLNRYVGGYAYLNNEMQVDYQMSESFYYDKHGNITNLNRFGSEDILDNLYLTYNGNQLKNVSDNGFTQGLYNTKEYQDKAKNDFNTSVEEMAYDKNGNLIKDLDRDIVTIRYNLLNLPDTIQFKNGNVIINHYSADGQKQRTDNYTRITAIAPVGENTVVNPENGYNDAIYSYTGTAYIGSFEYNIYKTKYQGYGGLWYYSDVFNPGKIYTPEGYIDNLSATISPIVSNGVRYNYYRKDHLGNIREVWNGVRKNYYNQVKELAATRQRTQYYPSGLPWAESFGAAVQKHKYNGKEFIEMHGLDEYDSEARWYYPAIMRTTTIDPLAEKYYSISPYAWCLNNPIIAIDPNGEDVVIWYKDTNSKSGMSSYRYSGGEVKSTNSYVRKVVNALNYNINNGGGDPSKKAVNCKNLNINIYETDGRQTSGYNTVYWNPYLGLLTDNGNLLSPATGLDHELDHAIQSVTKPIEYKNNRETSDPSYNNKEEKRVITGSEQKTAKSNGEIKKGKVTRNSYGNGKIVVTEGETSTKVNKEKTNEYNKKRNERFHNTFRSE